MRALVAVGVPLACLAYVVGVLVGVIWMSKEVLIGWAGWAPEGAFYVGSLLFLAATIGGFTLCFTLWEKD